MSQKLVIVESPSKSKTIEKYLGHDYKVISSLGHIRDLATTGKYGLGIDIENNFKPHYEIIKGKNKLVSDLKKYVKEADYVYLATDPDREGEAISWHLYDTLGLKENNYKRIVFNEITKDVILDSFNKARAIDDDLVRSQETRRMLDRIIGFRLSKLMQSKTGGKSAGRVQSVALKLIVDREREIEAFVPEDYYEIDAIFSEFEAKLDTYNNKKIEIKTEQEAQNIIAQLSKVFNIVSVDKQSKNKKAKPPYITSTLQQDASTKLNFTSKKTMQLAQKLYEGISLKDETVGLITYMRTDSIRLSDEFIKSTYGYIKNNYGENYIGYVKTTKKTDNVQDAHEAIRPTSINRTPESVKAYLTNDEYKLYRMIYYRALASLMKDAKTEATTVILDNNNYQFKATGSILTFDGYLKVYSDYESSKDKILPNFETYKSKVILSNSIEKEQHFTQPPARYTEAKLVEEMEKLGIGRPSTYATIMSNIKDRGYVTIEDKNTYTGTVVWADRSLDLSLVKINASNLIAANIGSSETVRVGETVYAIGNPVGFEFRRTVTSGIISALNRTVKLQENENDVYMSDLIQTDATINPGNSGGPLINTNGEVIGINSVKITTAEGIGFAVPIDVVKPVIESFIENGKFEEATLGLYVYDQSVSQYLNLKNRFTSGIYIQQIKKNGQAFGKGLKEGDIINKIDGKILNTVNDLRQYVYTKKPGDKVILSINNGRTTKEIEVILGKK